MAEEDHDIIVQENDDLSIDSDGEDECRVCRGPAEPGRELLSPCKCSGSIGKVHQDCLTSWLAVTRGDGRCELCSEKFRFAPLYKDGTPDRLSYSEVLSGLLLKAIAKWLPFGLRIMGVGFLWLIVVPLSTAYLYHCWTRRQLSISCRLTWELLGGDIISGIIVCTIIIISFLSLMSFADFLRFQWNGQRNRFAGRPAQNQEEDAQAAERRRLQEINEGVDDGLFELRQQRFAQPVGIMDEREPLYINDGLGERERKPDRPMVFAEEREHNGEPREMILNRLRAAARARHGGNLDEGAVPQDARNARERADSDEDLQVDLPDLIFEDQRNGQRHDPRNNQQNDQRNDPRPRLDMLDGPNQDDGADMEINLALDELLGLHGPISGVLKSVFWFLLFNTFYLCVFVFIPQAISVTVSLLLQSIPGFGSVPANSTETPEIQESSFLHSFDEIKYESERLDTMFRLSDFTLLLEGYLFLTVMVFFWRWVHLLYKQRLGNVDVDGQDSGVQDGNQNAQAPNEREGGDNWMDRVDGEIDRREEGEQIIDLRHLVDTGLECLFATSKVGILLFLKMFLLPLLLGIWLDTSTLTLFGRSLQDRILFTGQDLFASTLLHWVVGITFMLLVTVSVLQLREVLHPDLIAGIIRPQEPHPDLLANLLQEKITTHAKRMIISMSIYAALLLVYISLPAYLLTNLQLARFLPFARPRFCYILTAQLQIPIELLIFHLTMLGLLEKYKNQIGSLQHQWLRFLCEGMGLTNHMLPRTVGRLEFAGTHKVFHANRVEKQTAPHRVARVGKSDESRADEVMTEITSITDDDWSSQSPRSDTYFCLTADLDDANDLHPFWQKLATLKTKELEPHIQASIDPSLASLHTNGIDDANGRRLLNPKERYLRFPLSSVEPLRYSGMQSKFDDFVTVPTTCGPYRLRRRKVPGEGAKFAVIEFWREVPDKIIPRPPEGWDDLEEGGAEVQGRWAWDNEVKSGIENSVAWRSRFFPREQSISQKIVIVAKVTILAILSWLATTALVCFVLNAPLVVGRIVFHLLRVPDDYFHDPMGFAIGVAVLCPLLSSLSKNLFPATETGSLSLVMKMRAWVGSFRRPTADAKVFIVLASLFLWLFFIPLLIGTIYDVSLVKSRDFFCGLEPFWTLKSFAISWGAGMLLLHSWAYLCYCNVFRLVFWKRVIVGGELEQEDAPDEERSPDAIQWQGKNGNVAIFVRAMNAALFNWDWDSVDAVPLIWEGTLPITQFLMGTLWGASLSAMTFWMPLRLLFGATIDFQGKPLCLLPKNGCLKFCVQHSASSWISARGIDLWIRF